MTADGLIACISKFGPKETMDRLATAVASRGISIMARITPEVGLGSTAVKLALIYVLRTASDSRHCRSTTARLPAASLSVEISVGRDPDSPTDRPSAFMTNPGVSVLKHADRRRQCSEQVRFRGIPLLSGGLLSLGVRPARQTVGPLQTARFWLSNFMLSTDPTMSKDHPE